MSTEDSQLVLDAIAGRRPNSKNIVRANCPHCESVVHKTDRKSCLSFNVLTGWWKCFRCASEGHVDEEDLPFDNASLVSKTAVVEKPVMNLPEGFLGLWLPENKKALSTLQARRYLRKDRIGVTPAIIEAARIGACCTGKFRNRVVVPIYKAGKLAGYVGRLWWKKPPPGSLTYRYSEGFERATTLFNEEALYKTTNEPIIIVEGVFDTFPFWPHACAVLGKPSIGQKEMMLNARRPMLIVFDGDAHREATAMAMALRVRGKRVAALKLPPGVDPDECADHVNAKAREVFGPKQEMHADAG